MTTRLNGLFDEQGQSPWLDNLTRPYRLNGTLAGRSDRFRLTLR